MRSENLDPSSTASGRIRPELRRRRIVVTAIAIAASGAIGLVSGPSPASATTLMETFAGHGPTGPLELQLSETINQPANVAAGGKVTISVAGSSQRIPTAQSGVPVNFISGLHTLIPVPANSTFVSGSIVAGNWSFTPAGGAAKSGPLTVTECTGAGTGCTATAPDGKTFLGPGTSTPYIEATTGTTQFTAGGTLTLPAWSFDVTAASTGSIQSTVSEFDTSANITLGTTSLDIAVAAYPAATVTGCLATPAVCTTQPAYKFQPIATTTIGSSGGTTTTTASGATTTTTPGATTTTTAAGSSGATTTTTPGAAFAAGSSTGATPPASGTLVNTGPPQIVWLLGVLGLILLDIGYLSLSATWRGRRARNSSGG